MFHPQLRKNHYLCLINKARKLCNRLISIQFNDYYGFETLHPLVSVVRFDKAVVIDECDVHYGLYALFLKENKGCQLSYGRTKYNFGITAQDFIADAIVTRAKEILNDSSFTVSQVAYTLGFGYPQHFVRFFKRKTGKTPSEYRGAA